MVNLQQFFWQGIKHVISSAELFFIGFYIFRNILVLLTITSEAQQLFSLSY